MMVAQTTQRNKDINSTMGLLMAKSRDAFLDVLELLSLALGYF
jgi:hypothetical protein